MLQNTPADLDLHVTLLGKELRRIVSAKDLGVYMDTTLSFDEHITSVTSSCLSSLSQILPNHYVHPGYHKMRTHRRGSVQVSFAVG